jgi:1,5-anhydro-D-fructose reductase (1,5-anhydro-D-mannitol-forming)
MSETLKFGLIGVSNIAREWMHGAISRNPDTEVISVLGSDKERTETFAKDMEIAKTYLDLEAFLADPELDAVYISTTNEKHHYAAIAAARAGKHIICEKPLALTVAEAEEMVSVAQECGVVLATNHHIRNMETHRAIKAVIDSGEIGRITSGRVAFTVDLPEHLARWRMNDPGTGAGVMLDLTVHDVDTLRYYFGADPVRVVGLDASINPKADVIKDNVALIWEFPGKCLIVSQDTFLVPFGGTSIQLHGTKGSIMGDQVLWQTAQGEVSVTTTEGKRTIIVEHKVPYDRTIADFVLATKGQGQPSASGRDGLASLRFTLEAEKAIDTGCAVNLG